MAWSWSWFQVRSFKGCKECSTKCASGAYQVFKSLCKVQSFKFCVHNFSACQERDLLFPAGPLKVGETFPLELLNSLLPEFGFVSVAVCQASTHGSNSNRLLKCIYQLQRHSYSWQAAGDGAVQAGNAWHRAWGWRGAQRRVQSHPSCCSPAKPV